MRKQIISLCLALLLVLTPLTSLAVVDNEKVNVISSWPSFRGSPDNMAITNIETPKDCIESWSRELGSGWTETPSAQIIAEDNLVLMCGTKLLKLSLEDGSEVDSADMVGSPSYGYTPPAYSNGVIVAPLGKGTLQGFDFETFESKWTFTDPLAGQSLSPLTCYENKVYAGFWNGETKDADFVCVDLETGTCDWSYTVNGGFYWAGAVVVGDHVFVGTDNGSGSARILSFKLLYAENETVEPVSYVELPEECGDVRSSLAYSEGKVYFTTKVGYLCSADIDATTGIISGLKTEAIGGQSTSTPVVYGDYIYIGAGSGVSENGSSGSFVIADRETLKVVHHLDMLGYPQCSFLLSTAYLDSEGLLYFYSTYNANPGGVTLVKVNPYDVTKSELVEIFDANGKENYCISSIICDLRGNLYYKNDSGNIFCIKNVPTAYIYVTIADKGELVLDRESVTVTDINKDGQFDLDEVLYAAHEEYYEGGAAEGYSAYMTEYGLSLGMLWGDTSYNFGYFIDDQMAMSLSDPVTDGQHVKAYITVNSYPDMDAYSCFTSFNYFTSTDYPVDAELKYISGYDESWSPVFSNYADAELTAYSESGEIVEDGFAYTVNESGSYSLTFKNKGMYTIIAKTENNAIVPSACTVYVSDPINSFVTIVDKGTIPVNRENITVIDINHNGSYDIDDVLYIAHELFFDGGAAAGYRSDMTEYGLSLGMLWGDMSNNFGYYINNYMAFDLTYIVDPGDHVKAYITVNSYPDMDAYSNFENDEYTAFAGFPQRLKLLYVSGYDALWFPEFSFINTPLLTAYDENGEALSDEAFRYTKAADGSYAVQFASEGKFTVFASIEDNSVIPSSCTVEVSEAGQVFNDMNGHWADKYAAAVNKLGIMDGVGNNNFAPETTVTRAMLVTMLYALEGKPVEYVEDHFDDVPWDSWFSNAVEWAMKYSIVSGTGNNKFDPNAPVTREQMALILYRYAEYKNYDTANSSDISKFSDADKIHDYALTAVKWAAGVLINGYPDNTIRPLGASTRAEAATVIFAFLNNIVFGF